MIKPTVGRVVWFYDNGKNMAGVQPQAGIVTYVHSDRMINIAAFDPNGLNYSVTSVPLLQDADQPPEMQRFCMWMPYQVAQAQAVAVPPSTQ